MKRSVEGIVENAGEHRMLAENVQVVFVDSDRVGIFFAKSAARKASRFQPRISIWNRAILSHLS